MKPNLNSDRGVVISIMKVLRNKPSPSIHFDLSSVLCLMSLSATQEYVLNILETIYGTSCVFVIFRKS